jgi:hypothetical protein
MSLAKFLDQWQKNHPVYDPAQDSQVQDDKILTWLKDGGEFPLPTPGPGWPKLKGKK